jgi:hypothetical protein
MVWRPFGSRLGIADFAEQLLDALDLFYHKYGDVALLSITLNLVPDYICGAQYGWAGCEEGVPSFDPYLTKRLSSTHTITVCTGIFSKIARR